MYKIQQKYKWSHKINTEIHLDKPNTVRSESWVTPAIRRILSRAAVCQQIPRVMLKSIQGWS